MNSQIQDQILSVRLSVAALAEKHDWWKSALFQEGSGDLLSYVVPRLGSAALWTAFELARLKTDQLVGVGRYHLFRLPETEERSLFQQYRHPDDFDPVYQRTVGKEMETLQAISAHLAIDPGSGPMLLGNKSDLMEPEGIQALAATYLNAFQMGQEVHPYFQ